MDAAASGCGHIMSREHGRVGWTLSKLSAPTARFSKKPLLTVSSGQLSSFRMGVGGSSRRASGSSAGFSSRASASRSASSDSPCAAAVTYASAV